MKKYIYNQLIVFFFLVYAISPLSYNYFETHAVNHRPPERFNNFNVFLLELLCSALSPQSDPDNAPETQRYIIKKSHTVLRSPGKPISQHMNYSAALESRYYGTIVSSLPYDIAPKKLNKLSAIFSGLSPPEA